MNDRELENLRFTLQRLANPGRAAEGTNLPPRQVGANRVQVVNGFQLLRAKAVTGGTEFTLAWNNVPGAIRYQIQPYISNSLTSDRDLQTLPPQTAPKSPATVYIMYTGTSRPVLFKIQTVLGNGMESALENAPVVTGKTQ